MKAHRKRTTRWKRVVAWLLVALVAIPVLLVLLLQTHAGQRGLASWLSRELSSEGCTVRVEALRVALPAQATVGSVSLSDADGHWMAISNIDLTMDARGLLAGRLAARRLHVGSFHLARLPNTREGEAGARSAPLHIPAFRAEAVTLGEVRLAEAVWGIPVVLSAVRGRVQGRGSNGIAIVSIEADAERVAVNTTELERVAAAVDITFEPSGWGLARCDVRGDGWNVAGTLQPDGAIDVAAQLKGLPAGAASVTGAQVRMHGPWGAVAVEGSARGVYERPFSVEVAGALRWGGDRSGLELQRATLGWGGAEAQLVEPLRIWSAGDERAVSAAWQAEPFDLASVSNALPGVAGGRVTAGLRVRGTLAAPEFDGTLACKDLTTQLRHFEDAPSLSGACEFGYSNGVLGASAQATVATGGVATATARIPVRLSLQPWVLSLDRDRDLPMALDVGVNLAMLNGLDAFANSRLAGRLDLSVRHAGSLSRGTVTGTCVLAGGEYENYLFGTVIRGVHVRCVSRDDLLVVESGSATDGGKGSLSLTGQVRLSLAEGLPYVFEIGGRAAHLIRRPDVEATVSGTIRGTGTVSRIRVEGDLRCENARVELQNVRSSAPAMLMPIDAAESATAAPALSGTNVVLRLAAAIPGTLYVRGRSLDSQWAGSLVFGYAGGVPSLSGYLEPRRGTMLLLKRPFKLTEGRVDFGGGWPPDPSLRLTAEFTRADLAASVHVVGKALSPEITLTSQPALPEDEIFARILFGKDVATITPLQALSLASEATKLRNVGGGTGVLDDLTTAVGIDRVEFREASGGASATEVAAGKYLGDRSYVEVRRSASPNDAVGTRVHLEHELRPSIVLEAESGVDMRSGIGVFWRHDY